MKATVERRYNVGAIVLHWAIALLILANIGLAWWFNTLHGDAKIEPVQLHKSIGITVLILSVLRLALRFVVPPPPLSAVLKPWERWLARLVHALFYVVMIGMPLTGWAFSSASPLIHVFPIVLFHLVPWPTIAPLANLPHAQMKAAHALFLTSHQLLAKLAYGLIALHVAGALKHQLFDRDDELARMIPFLRRRPREVVHA
ncbi:MAG TPA: cytochrome b [Caulobacteraceae bacterium]|nr:cytochrome b [Caulobacteraceae bacterium]